MLEGNNRTEEELCEAAVEILMTCGEDVEELKREQEGLMALRKKVHSMIQTNKWKKIENEVEQLNVSLCRLLNANVLLYIQLLEEIKKIPTDEKERRGGETEEIKLMFVHQHLNRILDDINEHLKVYSYLPDKSLFINLAQSISHLGTKAIGIDTKKKVRELELLQPDPKEVILTAIDINNERYTHFMKAQKRVTTKPMKIESSSIKKPVIEKEMSTEEEPYDPYAISLFQSLSAYQIEEIPPILALNLRPEMPKYYIVRKDLLRLFKKALSENALLKEMAEDSVSDLKELEKEEQELKAKLKMLEMPFKRRNEKNF